MSELAKTVTLTIDGQEVTVPEGTLVIRAAEQLGITIPRFCDHEYLAPAGACRQCLVNITDAGNGRGFPKPQASCTIPVAQGMVVLTADEMASKAQRGIIEFLLINHPLDCPVCDKGGECPLQDQAMSAGQGETRFTGEKRKYPKPIPVSPNVLLDRERCVLCQRCTRFADQIAGDSSLVLIERGGQQQVGTADDQPFQSYFSGNVIEICPVGALTSAEYRFRSRPFDLVSTVTVGEHDSCGASVRVDYRHDSVLRRFANEEPEINDAWISDKDRFGYAYLNDENNLSHPWVRSVSDSGASELRPASWTEAFEVAARGLRASKHAGVLTGGRGTLEDARAYAFLARKILNTDDIDFRARPLSAEETEFLKAHVDGAPPVVTYTDLDHASTVVLAGLEVEDEAATIFLRLRKAVKAHGLKVIALSPFTTPGLHKLDADVVKVKPGQEAAALANLTLPEGAVVLAGERLATSPGALEAAYQLAEKSGAKFSWVPRRAGDRAAVRARAYPQEGGRDFGQILDAVRSGAIDTLVVGGVDPDDTADPAQTLAAVAQVPFLIALEQRRTAITDAADVIFPAATVMEKAGTFVTWGGQERLFPQIFHHPGTWSDAKILTHLAELYAEPSLEAAVLASLNGARS